MAKNPIESTRHEDDPDLKAPNWDKADVVVPTKPKAETNPKADPGIRVKPDQPVVEGTPFMAKPASGPQFAGVAGLGHGPGSETPHIMEANPLNPSGILNPGEVNTDGPKPDRAVDPRTGEWATSALQERLKDMTEEDAFSETLSGVYGETTAKNRGKQVIEALRFAGWTVTRP